MFKVDYFADLYDPAKAARVTHDAQKAMFIVEDAYNERLAKYVHEFLDDYTVE